MSSTNVIRNSDHLTNLASSLASNLRHSAFADLKIVCSDGSVWAHRLVLAAVSPVLRQLFLSFEQDEVTTLYLPQLNKIHVSLVLDYVYQGRMYIKACQLQHILGVIEVLSLECGVSVSKKVKEEDEAWVEEAVFQSFTDKGLGEVCKKLKIKEEEAFCTTSEKSNNLRRNSNCWWETAGNRRNNDDPGYEEEEDGEEAIEVVPKVSRSVRNSVANDEDEDYAVVECVSDSDDEDSKHLSYDRVQSFTELHGGIEEYKCVMCAKIFKHAENLRTHIQSHLGAKAHLRSCQRCKKNFRTGMEYDLHMISHAYVTYLKLKNNGRDPRKARSAAFGKSRRLVRASVKRLLPKQRPLPPSALSTVEEQDDDDRNSFINNKAEIISKKGDEKIPAEVKAAKNKKKKQNQTTTTKPQQPSTSTAFVRNGHQSMEPLTLKVTPTKKKTNNLSWASCKLKLKMPMLQLTPLKISPNFTTTKKPKANNIKTNTNTTNKGRKRKLAASSKELQQQQGSLLMPPLKINAQKRKLEPSPSTSPSKGGSLKMKAKKLRMESPRKPSTSSSSSISSPSHYHNNKKQTIEEKMTCTTCGQNFISKSILARHLQKSKHGIFVEDKDVMSPPPLISQALDKAKAEGRQLPHLNSVTQPKIEVGGREVNKYECHLCQQVFLRVKDLAKHRERMMCSAYMFSK